MQQFRSMLTNSTMLFVGFGLEDEYVMEVIGDVLETFKGVVGEHFALMKCGSQDAAQIFKQHNIHIIEYEDYGQPSVNKLGELAAASQEVAEIFDDTEQMLRPPVPPNYLEWLAKDCSKNVDLSGMRPKHGASITLRNVYVPVTTSVTVQHPSAPPPMEYAGVAYPISRQFEGRTSARLLQALANKSSLYISGPPGSGKTTFCRWLTLAVCQGKQPIQDVSPPNELQEPFPQELSGRLPVLIRLRDFWEALPAVVGGDELTRAELEAVLQQWITRKKFEGLTWTMVSDHLQARTCLLIFDGVDEVPLTSDEAENSTAPRAMLLAGLADAIAHWQQSGNRVLVTSRPYGLSDAQQSQLKLPHAPVADLSKPLQELLLRRWFRCLEDSLRSRLMKLSLTGVLASLLTS